jgi:CheY-like chemotaxis protein
MSGREALRLIKADPELRSIPVLVLTTSIAPEDIADAYEHGASSYIPKPGSLDELVNAVRVLCEFWFKVGVLPGTTER